MGRKARGPLKLQIESLESRIALSTYYVSISGNDVGAGSSAAPWRTLQHAADTVEAGDTVIVRAGNYTGFDMWTDGTAAAPIQFLADSGVNITSPNSRTPDGINLEGADYIVVDGFTVNGMPRTGIRSVLNHHVTIRNNHMDGNGKWGILTGFSDDLLIENNVTSRSIAEHGIYVGNSGDRPVIRNNTVWGNNGNGIHINSDRFQGGDGIISGALVENNTIYDNGVAGGSGINCDGVQDSLIRNNLLYNNHAGGISLYKIDGAQGAKNNTVVNNTIIQASDGRWALNISGGSTGNTVRNNIFYNHHSFRGSITCHADSLAGFTSDFNVVMDRFSTDGGDSRLTLSQWRSTTGQDQHSIIATPGQLFVSVANNDYHLKAGSPAIDAGTSQYAPNTDRDGNSRPNGNGFDIGAFESGTSTPNRPPIAVNDSAVTNQGADVNINVKANDSDPDGDALTVSAITQGTSGTVAINADGTVRYTPSAGFTGNDSFSYTISDSRGGTASATVNVQVQAVATIGLEADPWFPGKTYLVFRGTQTDDDVTFKLNTAKTAILVDINGVQRGSFALANVTRILAFGHAGNDRLFVSMIINKSAFLEGGAGNDILQGGALHDLLLGGDGNDTLTGHDGRDLLFAGRGADTLNAGGMQDLLVAGHTAYDLNADALRAIRGEWISGASYNQRVARLRAGTNGLPKLDATTVFADPEADSLTGGAHSDWFFADLLLDVIRDKAAAELTN